jgi:glycine rich protein
MVSRFTRTLWGGAALCALFFLALTGSATAATSTTFAYTGGEQTYTVPAGVTSVFVTATGARGGGPTSGYGTGGRGAVASGAISVTPGQTLYVEVGGIGGLPGGGFNGGGAGGSRNGLSVWGGGGASDVRTSSGTLGSRLIVAGGGGGSGFPAVGGGNAGQAGTGCCMAGPSLVPAVGGGAGTQTSGGAGGCTLGGPGCGTGCSATVACGSDGSLGVGGDGSSVGDAAATREGSGGGGGLWGGGGGGSVADLYVGGGGGGSSLVGARGVQTLAALSDPPSVVISTKVPKYLALEIPVYMCFDAGSVPAGTHIADLSYIDKGGGDRHLEMVAVIPVPAAAGGTFTVSIGGTPFATVTADSTGLVAPIELTGSAVPLLVDGNATVDIAAPAFGGFVVASSGCGG